MLVKHAFGVVDSNGTGEVGKAELYAGLLLVHLKLAKHAGPAACYVSTHRPLRMIGSVSYAHICLFLTHTHTNHINLF